MSDHHPLYDSCYPCSLSWGTFFCFSFVQVMSHRDDVLALCFYCELAREEKYEAMASKTEVLTRTKGVSWFCLTRFVRLPLRSRCFYLPALAVGVTTGKQLAIPSAFVFIREICVQKKVSVISVLSVWPFSAQSAPICVLCVLYRHSCSFKFTQKARKAQKCKCFTFVRVTRFLCFSDEITACRIMMVRKKVEACSHPFV